MTAITAPSLADLPFHPFAGQDIRTLIAAQATLRANHPFLVWEPFDGPDIGKTWTYAQFADRVARIAAGLSARGIKPGDRVLIHLDNCPEAVLAWFACAWMGAIGVTTNAKSSADELSYFADHSRAVCAITQPKFAELVATSCKHVRWISVTKDDNGADAGPNRPPASHAFDAIDGDPSTLPKRAHDPVAPFSIQYTSGTTSRPKAVLWTHANALWGARVNAEHEDLRPHDIHLVTLPLFHTNAQAYSVLAALWVGGTCVIQPRFSASRFWPVSLKHNCTWTSVVPFCVKALLEQPKPDAHHFRLWGSGVCEPPTDAHFKVKTLGWWGMTETITHGIVGSPHLPNVPLSIGRCAPEYQISVRDPDGRPVRPGEQGDLFIKGVRGLSLFAEYADNEPATREAFGPDGYFATGDRIIVGADQTLFFGDRMKDMLKVGGENVAASEIERVIITVPGVREVAVVARKHPMLDEVPVAFIIPQGGVAGAPPDLAAKAMAQCATMLAKFKWPVEIRLVDDMPRSTLEKVAKAELRRQLAES